MSNNLNPQQFAQFSSLKNPRADHDWNAPQTLPLPASMERHAPGEYQPTLPGMEKMLEGEMTHTSVVFKKPNLMDTETGEVKGSRWWHLTQGYNPRQVNARATSLHPSQNWLDDNYLHSKISDTTWAESGSRPKVEQIGGKNVIQDGHHRAARTILSKRPVVPIDQWGGRKK